MAALLQRELAGFERELDLFPDEESVWRTVPGVTNSAGNLALHIAGNVQHYIGAVLGGSGYVRDRAREFSARAVSREQIVRELRKAADAARVVLPNLTSDMLERHYPEAVVPNRRIQTLRFLLHLCAHASFHLGQAGYLRRVLTGQNQSAAPLPLTVLTEAVAATEQNEGSSGTGGFPSCRSCRRPARRCSPVRQLAGTH